MFTGVALGAFGAHALKDVLTPDDLKIWQTGIQYQLVHGLAILASTTVKESKLAERIVWAFVAGVILFSGSLYALALTHVKALGAITPLGGLCLLGGWLATIVAAKSLVGKGEES